MENLPVEVLLLIFAYLPSHGIAQIAATCTLWNTLTNEQVFWKQRCQRDFSAKAIKTIQKEHEESSWKKIYFYLRENTTKAYKRLMDVKAYSSRPDNELKLFAAALTGNTDRLHVLFDNEQLHLKDIFNVDNWDVTGEELLYPERHQQFGYELLEPYDSHACLLDFICLHQQQTVLDRLYSLALNERPENRLFWAVVCNQSQQELLTIMQETGSKVILLLSFTSRPSYEARLFELAVVFGHFELVKFLLEPYSNKSFELIKEALMIAVYRGHVEIVKYLHTCFTTIPTKEIGLYHYLIEIAASHGELSILEVLLSKHSMPSVLEKAFKAAVIGNCHLVLEALYKKYSAFFPQFFLQQMLFETLNADDPYRILCFLFDKGVDVFARDNFNRTIDNFCGKSQRLKNMVFCEIKIQNAIKLIKKQQEPWAFSPIISFSYLFTATTSFFQTNTSALLEEAYKLEPDYFCHRINVLMTNASCLHDKKTVAKLASLVQFLSMKMGFDITCRTQTSDCFFI
ncbi:ankyrin repeat domain-containing protein [Legionella cardiaca]|uniref:Ankyrin repeat domain-containing protein n=1 Tax=Legionella cardiaca TaxID=1071983 RepID=A0ABY8AM36_9GAMM|nr:ankyrin repeat domain-containing protein [Legionella cardiaca]WED41779.1 ankyrin repeat domain-containing protein [Legionella cardiaca]